MALVDEHMDSRWGATESNSGAVAALGKIDLGISQVTLMLEMIVDLQGERTADSERADALTLAAAAMLGQLGRSIDALDAYINNHIRAAWPNSRQETGRDHTSMEMLAQAVFDVVNDALPGRKA